MSEPTKKKSPVAGGIAAITTLMLGLLWIFDFGGMTYLYGLLIELFHVLFGFSLASFISALLIVKGRNGFGFLVGLIFGVATCLYLQFSR